MVFPYSGEALETFHKAFPFTQYFTNKVYQNPYGRYVYVNAKCYLHMLVPCKVKEDGEVVGYEINDYMLTKGNVLKHKKTYGWFKTKEECIEKILSFCG